MGSRRDNCKYNSLRWSTALAVAKTNTDLQYLVGQLKCPKNKTSRSFTVWFRRKSCVMRWKETEEVGFSKCTSIFSSYEFSSMNDLHALVNVVTNRPVRFPKMKYFTKHTKMSSPILNQLNFPQSRYESNKYSEILLIPVLKLLRRKVENFFPCARLFGRKWRNLIGKGRPELTPKTRTFSLKKKSFRQHR